jgi:EAL domain-containing protein (putative c-di-GMP-specific phosphodiesterase class I)
MELEGRLRHALRHGEIVPHFQPRVDLATGRIVGAEALARWTLPDGTRISPGEFIPVAEDLGLIFDLGEHMLRSSLAFTRALMDEGLPDITMAVNLSLVQCRHADLVGRVLAALRDTGVPPERLELEITESAIMSDVTRTLRRLDRLAALGITLAVDDFGTG